MLKIAIVNGIDKYLINKKKYDFSATNRRLSTIIIMPYTWAFEIKLPENMYFSFNIFIKSLIYNCYKTLVSQIVVLAT